MNLPCLTLVLPGDTSDSQTPSFFLFFWTLLRNFNNEGHAFILLSAVD